MTWHVQCRDEDGEHVLRYLTPEDAIEAACEMIHEGVDVHGIGVGALSDSIDRPQIDRIYDLWVRTRRPFGLK